MANLPLEQNHAIGPALGGLIERSEGNLAPGINCCAVCGLGSDGAGEVATGSVSLIDCADCLMLSYCSTGCMKKDRAVHHRVCAILRDIKDYGDINYTGANQHGGANDADDGANAEALATVVETLEERGLPDSWDALFDSDGVGGARAIDDKVRRLLSARLSYCCTLGWCVKTVPCLKDIRKRLRSTMTTSTSGGGGGDDDDEHEEDWVDILVLGASAAECGVSPRELWALATVPLLETSVGGEGAAADACAAAGGDAGLAVVYAQRRRRRRWPGLRVTFVGPEVPAELHGHTVAVAAEARGGRRCALRHFRGTFGSFLTFGARALATSLCGGGGGGGGGSGGVGAKKRARSSSSSAGNLGVGLPCDAVFGFNLGLTCEDYAWDLGDLAAAAEGLPLVLVTNTSAEASVDVECLEHDHGLRLRKRYSSRAAAPPADDAPASGGGGGSGGAAGSGSGSPGAAELPMNPFAWQAWRQSGTLGNDVYRKNSHVVCGRIAPSGVSYASLAMQVKDHSRKKRRKKGR